MYVGGTASIDRQVIAKQSAERGRASDVLQIDRSTVLPDGPNQRWRLDFVSDALTDARHFRILTVVDDFSRENLVLAADTSLSGQRVARELDRVIAERGMPRTIVADKAYINGGRLFP